MALHNFKNESEHEFHYGNVEKIFFFDWNEIESPFDILPMEMKTMIFLYLDPDDITQFGKCSKSCQKLFKLFRPKIKSVYFRGNTIRPLKNYQNYLIQVQFHGYPWNIYEVVVETLNSINSKKTRLKKLSRRNTQDYHYYTQESTVILTKYHRSNPKFRPMNALEMFKNIIEFNKSSIDEISIEATIIESKHMRSIDIYSENLKVLRIDGYFTDHPQWNQFLSVEFLEMKNFKISSQHFPMIKSKYLALDRTVMDKQLYTLFLRHWRDGLMENLREVSMVGDEHTWFDYLFVDYTMLRFVSGGDRDSLDPRNHSLRCVVVCSLSVDFSIQGVLIDDINNLPVRLNLRRKDF
ncbi:unnamed protein product [Caenorhabditis angaria]|uniref:F-box domain-containing protein n=1 Tax=Caenorhabditis angaria TaxID=860376 RepID=A0A9P1MYQ8_9PELO|nr:unnamed protein product [Caenorhabditis angaria]